MSNGASKQTPPHALGGLDSASSRPVAPLTELKLLRAIDELEAQLREASDVHKAARLTAKMAMNLTGADAVCVALLNPGVPEATAMQTGVFDPGPSKWDMRLLADFARGMKIEPPQEIALARLKRRARPWGTLALRWSRAEPGWDVRHALTRLTNAANNALDSIERQRSGEVRARIDRKIMEQLRPKDLFYQILDGLRTLTGYDHSGMLLGVTAEGGALEVAAEQMAWRKGKSRRIGAPVPLSDQTRAALTAGKVSGFSRSGRLWVPWDLTTPAPLAEWIGEGLPPGEADQPPEAEVICASLLTGSELAAVLRISALRPATFGMYECDLLASFLPQAMIAIRNAERTQTLEGRVLQAERKHAMAELARGVSHDVNNALGAVLPLVQQLRDDAANGRLDGLTLLGDLAQIERSVQVCTRIFGGMLKFARQAAAGATASRAKVAPAVDSVLGLLGEGLDRHAISLVRDIDLNTPDVPVRPTELEQILLNLFSNARDAMIANGPGGELIIRTQVAAGSLGPEVHLLVEDTGVGIATANLSMVFEPFFTTKASGNGLGLAVCRSIVWQAQGRIHVDSPARTPAAPPPRGPGCRFTVVLPGLAPEA